MKTQERRDGETLVIVTAMLGLAVVAFLGIVVFEGLSKLTGPVDGALDVVLWLVSGVLVIGLAAAPLRYLYRHRRPGGSG